MNIYTPVAFFVILVLMLLYASTPIFSAADIIWHKKASRTSTIDGLRGFLATGVFFHHAAIYYHYLLTASWKLPPSFFYTQLGQSAVSLFFMITGYLFWGKAIRARGHLPWKILYTGRLFRIGPLYYLATLLMLCIVFLKTGFIFHETLPALFKEIFPLFFMGFFDTATIINTYPGPNLILAGVTWTLHYEWLFYLLILPVAALFARPQGWHIRFSITGLFICLAVILKSHGMNWIALTDFFTGMVCASIQQQEYHLYARINARISDKIKSLLVVTLFALLAWHFWTAYAAIPVMMLGLVFLLITSGCSIFGLLNRRASRRLGEISYGIYILQGLALYTAFYYAPIRTFALGSALHYWLVVTMAGLGLVTAALIAHVTLELPGIETGKKLIKFLGRKKRLEAQT
ncbi:MAG: acyltransferase family protein [Sulfuriferula sp.]